MVGRERQCRCFHGNPAVWLITLLLLNGMKRLTAGEMRSKKRKYDDATWELLGLFWWISLWNSFIAWKWKMPFREISKSMTKNSSLILYIYILFLFSFFISLLWASFFMFCTACKVCHTYLFTYSILKGAVRNAVTFTQLYLQRCIKTLPQNLIVIWLTVFWLRPLSSGSTTDSCSDLQSTVGRFWQQC